MADEDRETRAAVQSRGGVGSRTSANTGDTPTPTCRRASRRSPYSGGMGNRIRQMLPDEVHFITNRCAEARFLLGPCEDVDAILGEELARSARNNRVELFAFLVMARRADRAILQQVHRADRQQRGCHPRRP